MEALLSYNDVGFIRSNTTILHDINWQAHQGEHWVILGPNGAGKTTLISMAAARNYPSTGTVWVLGERLGRVEVADIHAQVGVCSSAVLQRIPNDNNVERLILNAAYGTLGSTRSQVFDEVDHERADNLMNVFGIKHLATRRVSTLSDGERQRMMLCRALMADPEILILDEPAAGVDLGAREELMMALSELATDPRSPMMILVTHHVEEIPPNFTHAMIMNNGTIDSAGRVEEVVTSDNLSRVFGIPLRCERHHGRFQATALIGGN